MLFSIRFLCRCSFPLYLIPNLLWTSYFGSFSIYNLVFSDARRRLREKKIFKALVFLCINTNTVTVEFFMNILFQDILIPLFAGFGTLVLVLD